MSLLKRKAAPDIRGFFTVAPADAIRPEEMTVVTLNGRRLILTRWQGQVYAFSSVCPHAAADLAQGTVFKGQVQCPDHGYCFDIRSGRPTWPEDEVCHLKRYMVKEEDGLVKVKLE
jgi:nitrite reductase/ring-hydroxylating ferredoxin subunit